MFKMEQIFIKKIENRGFYAKYKGEFGFIQNDNFVPFSKYELLEKYSFFESDSGWIKFDSLEAFNEEYRKEYSTNRIRAIILIIVLVIMFIYLLYFI